MIVPGRLDDREADLPSHTLRRYPETLAGTRALDGALDSDSDALTRGELLGRYVVLDRLGAGGMGVVYAAYDPELDRKVALKLLLPRQKEGQGDDSDARIRLQREAQALARLDHRNVVAIHDVGMLGDRVYLAMEFIEGRTLSAWLQAAPRGWREVLAVILAAGEGLAAAHEKGLIHRDIKPDNIMVDGDGRVRVMDFGLARTGDEAAAERPALAAGVSHGADALGSELTRTGSVMGTPAYMAPEQFHGLATDARTDQFSLCATAWEALYRQRPFAGDSFALLAASVVGGRLVSPPPRSPVPTWLRRVLERGLRNSPAERFPDTQALLAALRADPTPRRKAMAAAAAVVAAALGGYALHSTERERASAACAARGAAIFDDWSADARAALERSFLATGKPYAATMAAKTAMWFDRWTESWRAASEAACRAHTVDERWSDELHAQAQDCLSEARGSFVALARTLSRAGDTAVLRASAAAAALAPVDRCTQAAALLQRPTMRGGQRLAVLAVRTRLAETSSLEAAGDYEAGLAVAEAARGGARATGWPAVVAQAELCTASLEEAAGEFTRAEASLRRALAAAREARAADEALTSTSELVFVVGYLAARHAEGKVWAEAAETQLALLAGEHPLQRAFLDNNLANVLEASGAYDEALRLHERALALREAALGKDHPDVAASLDNLAGVHLALGSSEEALRLHTRALEIYERALGWAHPDVADSLNNLANTWQARGEYKEAARLHRRALAIYEQTLGDQHPRAAQSLNNLGLAHYAMGNHGEAGALFTRALAIQETVKGKTHPDVATTLNNLANVRHNTREFAEAARLYARSLAIYEQSLGKHHPDVAQSLINLAYVHTELGAYDEATRLFTRALAILEQALDGDHASLAFALHGLGAIDLAQGRPAEAIPRFERAQAIRAAAGVPEEFLAETRFALARALWDADADRPRARILAEQVQRAHLAGVGTYQERLAVQAWLASHPAPASP